LRRFLRPEATQSVNIDELKIPENIDVSMGYVPTVFHKFNTTIEQEREKDAPNRDGERRLEALDRQLDPSALAAMEKIEAFLETRRDETKQ
jgi:hypothetical protein